MSNQGSVRAERAERTERATVSSDVPGPENDDRPPNNLFTRSQSVTGGYSGNSGHRNVFGDNNNNTSNNNTSNNNTSNSNTSTHHHITNITVAGMASIGADLKSAPIPSSKEIGERLKDVITNRQKDLRKIYGETGPELDNRLESRIEKGVEMAKKLIREMGCPFRIAIDLTVLTLYDVAILIDDSDSMVREENGKRKKTLIQFIDLITETYSMANESGIRAMRFMNSGRGKSDWTDKSQEYLDHHSYGGVSRIGTELKKKILDPLATGNGNQRKPLLVLIVTSSAVCPSPNISEAIVTIKKQVQDERGGHLKNVIRDCVNERRGASKGFGAVLFQFTRIGKDSDAARLLMDLDRDPDLTESIGVFPVEFDLEPRPEDKWFVLRKILLGAIDRDQQDYQYPVERKDSLAGGGKPHFSPLAEQSTKHGGQRGQQDYQYPVEKKDSLAGGGKPHFSPLAEQSTKHGGQRGQQDYQYPVEKKDSLARGGKDFGQSSSGDELQERITKDGTAWGFCTKSVVVDPFARRSRESRRIAKDGAAWASAQNLLLWMPLRGGAGRAGE
ncbi:hypothetical protein B9Z19DRAFT_683156 [Tuber borchii]|uniref:VWFA domain-containing protein n=1 Tax=Tuber borchii TaxID=42251 RepID=A0A2T6ZZB8_TUBBO|nr:hypothetical protein B9Z19DRAFT_683156 [Tuber borchii]